MNEHVEFRVIKIYSGGAVILMKILLSDIPDRLIERILQNCLTCPIGSSFFDNNENALASSETGVRIFPIPVQSYSYPHTCSGLEVTLGQGGIELTACMVLSGTDVSVGPDIILTRSDAPCSLLF